MEYKLREPEYNQARGSVGNFVCDLFENMGDILSSKYNSKDVKRKTLDKDSDFPLSVLDLRNRKD